MLLLLEVEEVEASNNFFAYACQTTHIHTPHLVIIIIIIIIIIIMMGIEEELCGRPRAALRMML
jgi:hypothetical protein